MTVSASCHHAVSKIHKTTGNSFSILYDLSLILLKLLCVSLLHSDSNPSYGVVMRPTLQPWEHGQVDLVLDVVHGLHTVPVHAPHPLPVENDACPGTSESLVHGAGDHVAVLEGGGDQASGHQPRHVRHVGHQPATILVSDLLESFVV